MRSVLVSVLVLFGCKKEQPAPAPGEPPSRDTPAAAAAPADAATATASPPAAPRPCPTGDALKAAGASAARAAAPEDVTEISCNEMTTPRKAWLLDGIASNDGMYQGFVALLDARDGKLIAKENTGSSDTGLAKATITIADLDGDGADELLRSATVGGHGFAAEALHVLAVRGDKLVEVGKLPVRSENTGAVAIGEAKSKDHYECQSTTKVIAGAPGKKLIEIVGDKRKGKPPAEECPAVGRHVYAFDGKAVAEVRPAK